HTGVAPPAAAKPVLSNLDDLFREASPAPAPELPALFKIAKMPGDGLYQLRRAVPRGRDHADDGRDPDVTLLLLRRAPGNAPWIVQVFELYTVVGRHVPQGQADAHSQHELHVVADSVGARTVRLVDDEQVGDL